jgi:hypothetical protein
MAYSTVNIPEELMARIQQAAGAEKLSPEALVHEAVEEHLRRKRLLDLYSYGEGQARKLGINESEVDEIVKAGRRDLAQRER